MARPSLTVTQAARKAIIDYNARNPASRIAMERGEWRILQSDTRNDGGVYVLGIYNAGSAHSGHIMQRDAEHLREAIRNFTGRMTIVEILFEEGA